MHNNRPWERWDDPGVAEEIDQYWMVDPGGFEHFHRKILARMTGTYLASPLDEVLEVGCGSGVLYGALVPKVLINSRYVGVDISQKMLDIARNRYPAGQFLLGDIYNLQFPSHTFDMTLCFEVLGHLPEIVRPISELLRVTKKLLIMTAWISETEQTITRTEERGGSKFLHQYYSHSEISAAIREASSEIKRVEVRILSDKTWAYVIFKGKGEKIEEVMSPFMGYTDHFILQHSKSKSQFEKLTERLNQSKEERNGYRNELARLEKQLDEVKTKLGVNEAEVANLRIEVRDLVQKLCQAEGIAEEQERKLEEFEGALKDKAADLDSALVTLKSRETEFEGQQAELERMRIALAEREGQIDQERRTRVTIQSGLDQVRNKAESIAQELDLFRNSKATRVLNRFLSKPDFRGVISASFQQLIDDSLIFKPRFKGFELSPSINLRKVPFVYYPLELNRKGLKGILLAAILELPPKNGVLGIEIVSPKSSIVLQRMVALTQINETVPTLFNFTPILDSDKGRFWLRVFVQDADVSVRVFEWQKYSLLGLGPLRTKAFCGFLF